MARPIWLLPRPVRERRGGKGRGVRGRSSPRPGWRPHNRLTPVKRSAVNPVHKMPSSPRVQVASNASLQRPTTETGVDQNGPPSPSPSNTWRRFRYGAAVRVLPRRNSMSAGFSRAGRAASTEGSGQAHLRLETCEVGTPLRIEHHGLSIQRRGPGRNSGQPLKSWLGGRDLTPERERSTSVPSPGRYTRTRCPSYFVSAAHLLSVAGAGTEPKVASIGSNRGGRRCPTPGRSRAPPYTVETSSTERPRQHEAVPWAGSFGSPG